MGVYFEWPRASQDASGREIFKSKASFCGGQTGDKIGSTKEIKKGCYHATLNINGAPGVTRTRGTRIRNPLLYPPELQGHQNIYTIP